METNSARRSSLDAYEGVVAKQKGSTAKITALRDGVLELRLAAKAYVPARRAAKLNPIIATSRSGDLPDSVCWQDRCTYTFERGQATGRERVLRQAQLKPSVGQI